METISCHSNQSSFPTGIKTHNVCRGQCLMQVCQVSASSSLRFLRRRILNIFFENLPFMSFCQPNKSSDLDKSRMKHGGLLNKHFFKKIKYPIHFSRYKSMETLSCHSNQSSYPTETKNIIFVEGNVIRKFAEFRLHPSYGF